ncbi:MAG: alkaline phosphatase [Alphaproteobacteria bacterium]|nr:MAG: alkaline phosphatase [Alphaproteobacteria bacterium]
MQKFTVLKLAATLIVGTTMSACQTTDVSTVSAFNNPNKAKNVILFIGDGMGISTITAARIFAGQNKGMSGEDNSLSFEEYPNVALVKTYNLDAQVSDSAGTASAMNTGMKTQLNKINVQPGALFAGCLRGSGVAPKLFAELVEDAGMSTGIISTARITHATPAAVYGHAYDREWESDKDLSETAKEKGCTDLATQLIDFKSGNGLDVVLGGGQRSFLPANKIEDGRVDGKDLTVAWERKSSKHVYVSSADQLRNLDAADTQSVLGLFKKSHLSFETSRDNEKEPGLRELTQFAIENLEARNTGYFLMIESGRIDHAHHASNAYRALSETEELAKAVELADSLTNDEDTLILVTADHSHVFTIAGYPVIGNPILGLVHSFDDDMNPANEPYLDGDGKPYTTLGYQNGINPREGDAALTQDEVLDLELKVHFIWWPPINRTLAYLKGQTFLLYRHPVRHSHQDDLSEVTMHEAVHYISANQPQEQKRVLSKQFLDVCPAKSKNFYHLLEEPLAVAWGQAAFAKYGRNQPLDPSKSWYRSPMPEVMGRLLWLHIDKIFEKEETINDGIIGFAAAYCARILDINKTVKRKRRYWGLLGKRDVAKLMEIRPKQDGEPVSVNAP